MNKFVLQISRVSRYGKISVLCSGLLFLGLGCGGGGGGGDGGNVGGLKRSTDTGVRVIHGGVRQSPVVVKGILLTTADVSYTSEQFYTPASAGAQSLVIDRSTTGQTLASLSATLVEKQEYSVLIYDQSDNRLGARLFVDPVARPEKGFATLRLIHSFQGAGNLTLATLGAAPVSAKFTDSSELITVPIGVREITVRNASGTRLTSLTVDLPEQSEGTVVVSGSAALGFVQARVLLDLD